MAFYVHKTVEDACYGRGSGTDLLGISGMSYYITTHEVPISLLEKLKTLVPDYDQQEDAYYAWQRKIPQVAAFNVKEVPP